MTLGADGKVSGWEAVPWTSGGSAAIMLARPDDAALVARVRGVLDRLKADPANKIATIADRGQIAAIGGMTQASFFVDFAPDATAGGFKGPNAPIASPAGSKGTHGFFPASPLMRSTFLIMGPGIAPGRNLGEIDMRAIAPTLAAALKTSLPGADLPPLDLKAAPFPKR